VSTSDGMDQRVTGRNRGDEGGSSVSDKEPSVEVAECSGVIELPIEVGWVVGVDGIEFDVFSYLELTAGVTT